MARAGASMAGARPPARLSPPRHELRAAEDWLARQSERLEPLPTQLQTEFIVASRRAESRRLRILLGAALVAVLVSAALAAFALVQRSEAIAQRDRAQSRQLAAASASQLQVDPELSILLALEASTRTRRLRREMHLRRALVESHVGRTLRGHEDNVSEVAYSPEGDVLATRRATGRSSSRAPRTGPSSASSKLEARDRSEASPSRRRRPPSDAGRRATVRLWNLEGEELATFAGDRGPSARTAAASSPGVRTDGPGLRGRHGRGDRTARARAAVRSVAFSPDGGTVLFAEGPIAGGKAAGTVVLWDVRSGEATEIGTFARAGLLGLVRCGRRACLNVGSTRPASGMLPSGNSSRPRR